MLKSMTGFGKATGCYAGQEVVVELSSVNHRYFDINLRLPNNWLALEAEIKQFLREKISRGKIFGNISRKRLYGSALSVQFDMETAKQYIAASRQLAELLGTTETLSLNTLVTLEGVFIPAEPEENLDEIRAALLPIIDTAIVQLNEMRSREGQKLFEDIVSRIATLQSLLQRIEQRLPEIRAEYEKKIRTKLEELKTEIPLLEERISVEVALLAEKADATEELVRIKAHLDHLLTLIQKGDPVGRQLDFLAQELQREANTLGVKTRDAQVIQDILLIKAEIEKIREQVQNIE